MNTITITESYNNQKTKPEQCIATANQKLNIQNFKHIHCMPIY